MLYYTCNCLYLALYVPYYSSVAIITISTDTEWQGNEGWVNEYVHNSPSTSHNTDPPQPNQGIKYKGF
jgi:hypothetical protein